jgi:hypothetical protein
VRMVAHLIRADVRRSWPLLCTWLVMTIVSAVMPCVIPMLAGGDSRLLSSLELPAGLIAVAYPLVLLVLVVHVVQTHPLVGTSAFWMTRPIPPRVLLASKAALLGVMAVVVPMIVEVVRMMIHGVPWIAQVGVAIDTALRHAFLLALLMLGAAVTRNMSRFLLMVGTTLASLAVLITILIVVESQGGRVPSSAGWSEPRDSTAGLLQTVLLIAALAGALLIQYVTRLRVRTAAVTVAAMAAAVLFSNAWPWELVGPVDALPVWARDDAVQVRAGNPHALEAFDWPGLDRERLVGVRGPLALEGIEPNFIGRVGITRASLWVDGTPLASFGDLAPASIPPTGDAPHPAVAVPRHVLGVDRLAVQPWDRLETPTLFFFSAAEHGEYLPSTGRYEGRVRVVLQRHEVEGALPVTVGAVHHRGAYRVTIDAVDHHWGNLTVHVHESRAASTFDRTPYASYSFYLRNAQRREAVSGAAQPIGETVSVQNFSFSISGGRQDEFKAREVLLRFFIPEKVEGAPIVLDEAWMAGAELVIVSMIRAGSLERNLEIPNFPLSLPSRATH